MENSILKYKLDVIINFIDNKIEKKEKLLHIYIQELGWITLILDELEIVTDDLYTSAKYSKSEIFYDTDFGLFITIKNAYKKNVFAIENKNNQIYNLAFNEIDIFVDKIIAYY